MCGKQHCSCLLHAFVQVWGIEAVEAVLDFKWRTWAKHLLWAELGAYIIWLAAFQVFVLLFQASHAVTAYLPAAYSAPSILLHQNHTTWCCTDSKLWSCPGRMRCLLLQSQHASGPDALLNGSIEMLFEPCAYRMRTQTPICNSWPTHGPGRSRCWQTSLPWPACCPSSTLRRSLLLSMVPPGG